MLAELRDDNKSLTLSHARRSTACATITVTSATASLLEVWIDETERRTWFLFEDNARRPGAKRLISPSARIGYRPICLREAETPPAALDR